MCWWIAHLGDTSTIVPLNRNVTILTPPPPSFPTVFSWCTHRVPDKIRTVRFVENWSRFGLFFIWGDAFTFCTYPSFCNLAIFNFFCVLVFSVVDAWHFGADPNPRIRASDQWIRIRILLLSCLAFKTPTQKWATIFCRSFSVYYFWRYIYIIFLR